MVLRRRALSVNRCYRSATLSAPMEALRKIIVTNVYTAASSWFIETVIGPHRSRDALNVECVSVRVCAHSLEEVHPLYSLVVHVSLRLYCYGIDRLPDEHWACGHCDSLLWRLYIGKTFLFLLLIIVSLWHLGSTVTTGLLPFVGLRNSFARHLASCRILDWATISLTAVTFASVHLYLGVSTLPTGHLHHDH